MVGHQFTWSNGGKNSCIDFIVVNDKLRNYLNIASVYATLLMTSLTIYHLFFLVKKISPDGFVTPPRDKQIKWSNRICRDKREAIFSHNKFTCLTG